MRPAPSVDGAERRSRARASASQGVPSARALAKCRASLCDAPRGAKGSGGGPAAWTRPQRTRRTRPRPVEQDMAAAKAAVFWGF